MAVRPVHPSGKMLPPHDAFRHNAKTRQPRSYEGKKEKVSISSSPSSLSSVFVTLFTFCTIFREKRNGDLCDSARRERVYPLGSAALVDPLHNSLSSNSAITSRRRDLQRHEVCAKNKNKKKEPRYSDI